MNIPHGFDLPNVPEERIAPEPCRVERIIGYRSQSLSFYREIQPCLATLSLNLSILLLFLFIALSNAVAPAASIHSHSIIHRSSFQAVQAIPILRFFATQGDWSLRWRNSHCKDMIKEVIGCLSDGIDCTSLLLW